MKKKLSQLAVAVAVLLDVSAANGRILRNRASAACVVPGNSRNGLAVFSSKGCHACHSLPGEVAHGAPAIGGQQQSPLTEAGIAANLWNHAPQMWARMAQRSVGHSAIKATEMADLFAFLYYMSVLDPEGSPARGRWLFLERRCDNCHAVSLGEPAKAGPTVQYWSAHTTPIGLAQAMWNHARKVQTEVSRRGMQWVKLENSDIANIVAYIRTINWIAEKKEFLVGDQARGRDLFADRGCARCHSISKSEATIGPSIEEMNGAATRVGDLGALMWNHFPKMNARLGDLPPAKLAVSVDEMADLFAYLFSVGYFSEPGDPIKGRAVFVSKQCSRCHDEDGPGRKPMKYITGNVSMISLATCLWNQGPRMMQEMQTAGLAWPQLTHQEVADLVAYLNTRDGVPPQTVAHTRPSRSH